MLFFGVNAQASKAVRKSFQTLGKKGKKPISQGCRAGAKLFKSKIKPPKKTGLLRS